MKPYVWVEGGFGGSYPPPLHFSPIGEIWKEIFNILNIFFFIFYPSIFIFNKSSITSNQTPSQLTIMLSLYFVSLTDLNFLQSPVYRVLWEEAFLPEQLAQASLCSGKRPLRTTLRPIIMDINKNKNSQLEGILVPLSLLTPPKQVRPLLPPSKLTTPLSAINKTIPTITSTVLPAPLSFLRFVIIFLITFWSRVGHKY